MATRSTMAFAVGAALAVAGFLCAQTGASADPRGGQSADYYRVEAGTLSYLHEEGPCHDARHTPLEEIGDRVALVRQVALRSPTALPGSIVSSWLCGGGESALLRYDSGIDIWFNPGWRGIDVRSKWQSMIDQSNALTPGSGGSISAVGKASVLVLEPDRPGAEGDHPGLVRGVLGDTLISVSGTSGVTVNELLTVLASQLA